MIVGGGVIVYQKNKQSASTSVNTKIEKTNSFCNGLNESDCFAELSDCQEGEAGLKKNFSELTGGDASIVVNDKKDYPKEFVEKIKRNFPNSKIVDIHITQYKNDSGSDVPYLKFGERYCSLSEPKNQPYLFGPIKSRSEALEYYKTKNFDSLETLKAASSEDYKVLINSEDDIKKVLDTFKKDNENQKCSLTNENVSKSVNGNYTTVTDIPGGYKIIGVYFSRNHRGLLREAVNVSSDGEITDGDNTDDNYPYGWVIQCGYDQSTPSVGESGTNYKPKYVYETRKYSPDDFVLRSFNGLYNKAELYRSKNNDSFSGLCQSDDMAQEIAVEKIYLNKKGYKGFSCIDQSTSYAFTLDKSEKLLAPVCKTNEYAMVSGVLEVYKDEDGLSWLSCKPDGNKDVRLETDFEIVPGVDPVLIDSSITRDYLEQINVTKLIKNEED